MRNTLAARLHASIATGSPPPTGRVDPIAVPPAIVPASLPSTNREIETVHPTWTKQANAVMLLERVRQ